MNGIRAVNVIFMIKENLAQCGAETFLKKTHANTGLNPLKGIEVVKKITYDMNKDRIAKNLLENKTCDNCDFFDIEFYGIQSCMHSCKPFETGKDLPEHRTCENWELVDKSIKAGILKVKRLFGATYKKKENGQEPVVGK